MTKKKTVTFEEITNNNNQWYITPFDAKNLVKDEKLFGYEFCDIELGKVRRYKHKKFTTLKETVNYQFLSNQNSKEALAKYVEYCKDPVNLEDNNRSPEIFVNLYKKILQEGYDPKKGVIVIDQYDSIVIGLHRACSLLLIHGENKKIPVLKINIRSSSRMFFANLIYNFIKKLKQKR